MFSRNLRNVLKISRNFVQNSIQFIFLYVKSLLFSLILNHFISSIWFLWGTRHSRDFGGLEVEGREERHRRAPAEEGRSSPLGALGNNSETWRGMYVLSKFYLPPALLAARSFFHRLPGLWSTCAEQACGATLRRGQGRWEEEEGGEEQGCRDFFTICKKYMVPLSGRLPRIFAAEFYKGSVIFILQISKICKIVF